MPRATVPKKTLEPIATFAVFWDDSLVKLIMSSAYQQECTMMIDDNGRFHDDDGRYGSARDKRIYETSREEGRKWGFRQCAEMVARGLGWPVRAVFSLLGSSKDDNERRSAA